MSDPSAANPGRTGRELTRMAVVVPACDEAEHLPACLAAIAVAAAQVLRRGVRVDVLVMLDSCTDASASVVRGYPGVGMLTVGYRCVGATRAAGARAALVGAGEPSTVWLAGTDADSQVPPNWLSHQLECAQDGADVVIGTVVPLGLRLPADVHRLWTGRHANVEGHPHVHGANLGVRADAYLAAGGYAAMATGEDLDLTLRLALLPGVVIRRSAAAPVRTSDRLAGRAPDGFAAYLTALHGEVGGEIELGVRTRPERPRARRRSRARAPR